MQTERKVQTLSWWISSIAISVVCCSVLFVIFASYLTDLKADIRTNNQRIMDIKVSLDNVSARLLAIQHALPEGSLPGQSAAQSAVPVPVPAAAISGVSDMAAMPQANNATAPTTPPVGGSGSTTAAPAITAPILNTPAVNAPAATAPAAGQ